MVKFILGKSFPLYRESNHAVLHKYDIVSQAENANASGNYVRAYKLGRMACCCNVGVYFVVICILIIVTVFMGVIIYLSW